MPTAVIPFQLAVAGRATSGYALRAAAAGRVTEAALELPPLDGDREAIGQALGKALFPAPVRQLLIDVARGADEAGARVQIQLQVAPPELATLPWEWATLGRESPWRPAVREDYTFVRSIHRAYPSPPLDLDGPLRLLVACGPGSTAAAAPLGYGLADAVSSGRLVVDLLRDAEPNGLRDALAEEPCHGLHLVADEAIGSGSAARLRLGRGLDVAGLAGILEDYPELRFVTLAAPADGSTALADLAGDLHRQLGVAVVALGAVSHNEAATFCGPCYSALAAGDPLDLAATDGRGALQAAGGPWGAPQVWLVPGTEQLFAPAPLRSVAASRPRPAPAPEPDGPSIPVGTPLRPRRDLAAPAARALAAARSFVVEATQVGEPAQRSKPEPRQSWFQPKLIALAVACAVLVFMISQVLDTPADRNTATTATALAATALSATAAPTIVVSPTVEPTSAALDRPRAAAPALIPASYRSPSAAP